MKIVEVIPTLNVGGAEKFVVNLSAHLSDLGHECHLVTLFDASSMQTQVAGLPSSVVRSSLGKSHGFDFQCLLRLMKFIAKEKPDAVHAHIGAITYLLFAAVFCRKTRYFATIHSEAKREAGSLLHRLVRKFLFKLNLVTPVTISEESRASFVDFYGMQPSMIYNGSPDFKGAIAAVDNSKKVFVHVASCQPVKNQELLLKSFALLTEKYKDVELHWYGSNTSYPELFASLSSYFSDRIMYKGIISEVRSVLSDATAMCLSSKMEGMPMTIIEAMSVGCIPAATPVGGCKNMISDGINGFLSADLSVESYSKMLEKIITLPESKLKEMRSNSRLSYESQYSIGICANLYLDLFQN